MECFCGAAQRRRAINLIFVNGNQDYQYALFDIESADGLVSPGGVIAVDKISQGPPLHAACDFIRERPAPRESPLAKAFDLEGGTIRGTDLCVLPTTASCRRLETGGSGVRRRGRFGGIVLPIAHAACRTRKRSVT